MDKEEKSKLIAESMYMASKITSLCEDLVGGMKAINKVTEGKYKKQIDAVNCGIGAITQKIILSSVPEVELTEEEKTLYIQVSLILQRLEKFYEDNFDDFIRESKIYTGQ